MSIKKKLLITFSSTLFVFLLVYSLTTEFFIVKGFHELEYEHVKKNSDLALRVLKLEEEKVDQLAYDWASWDQMYHFVNNKNVDFIKSNITSGILRDLDLSFLLIINKKAEVVYYQNDQSKSSFISQRMPPDNWKLFKKIIAKCAGGNHKAGILFIDNNFYFLAARPILKSDDSGPPNGMLIIGSCFDDTIQNRLSKIIGQKFKVFRAVNLTQDMLFKSKYFQVIVNNDVYISRTVVKDIFNKPSLVLEFTFPRKIIKYGSTTAHLAIFAAVAVGMILGVVLLWQLKRLIFTKIDHLTAEVADITETGDLSRRLSEYEEDELGILVKGFNNLLEKVSRFSEELMLSKNKYKTLFEQSPAGIFVFDTDLKVIECNESICRMIGAPRGALLGMDLRKLRHKEIIPALEAALKGQRPKYYGLYRATTTDVQIWSSTTLAPLYDQDGKITGGIGIVEDISEIKKYEWALEDSRAHLEAVLESASGYGILTTDPDFVITYFNGEAGRIFGCSPDDARVRKIEELGKGFANLEKHFREAIGSVEKGMIYQFTFDKAKGEEIEYFSCRLSGIVNNDDELLGYVLFVEDITEELRAEKEKKELQEQLFHAQKMEAIGRLSGGVAHDFNNLLTGIIGLAQLAMESVGKKSDSYEILAQILASAKRGASLTKQLLNLTRKTIIRPHTIDLVEIVNGMESMLGSVIGEDLQFEVETPESAVYIQADPAQIEQVIMNLVINARDAMPEGGRLTVAVKDFSMGHENLADKGCRRDKEYVCLVVSDTGCGMDDEVQSKIFDPFYTTKPPGKGTGLGLSTVYGIIKQLGGYIEVESAPGHGTTFIIYIPKVLRPVIEEEEEVALVYEKPESPESISILVVEDEIAILDIISFVLRREGYRVYSALNGKEAIEIISSKNTHVDLLIADLIMPGMSGTELASCLKEQFPEIRIIYTSGYTEDMLVQKDKLEWDAVFLEKPFSPNDLLRLCAIVLQKGEKESEK